MPTRTNEDRVKEFERILALFHAMTGVDPAPTGDGPEVAVSDLMAHAQHYCAAKGVDLIDCLDRGTGHYSAEVFEERAPTPIHRPGWPIRPMGGI